MKYKWEPLDVREGGYVFNARAHDSNVLSVGRVATTSIGIAWKTWDGHLHAVRARPGSNAQFFASGMIHYVIIGGLYFKESKELGLPDDEMRFTPEVLSLRKMAQARMGYPDWYLEITPNYGDYMLIAGKGGPDVLETKKITHLAELYED